jgi:cytoskeleton protein RodZ
MAVIKGDFHFGQFLQQCRREKDIPIEAVSRVTRISASCLRQIESEDLAGLPAPLYVKSFLKSYAEAIGVDPEEVLRRYENALDLCAHNAQAQPQISRRKAFWPHLLLVFVLFGAVIFFTLHVAQLMNSGNEPAPLISTAVEPGHSSVPVSVQKITGQVVDVQPELPEAIVQDGEPSAEVAQSFEQTEQVVATREQPQQTEPFKEQDRAGAPPEPSQQVQTERLLKLELSAVEPTWIKAIADGHDTRHFSLKPDERVTLEAKNQFNLLIGNAGGIRLFLNGDEIQVPGKSGQVVTLQLPR